MSRIILLAAALFLTAGIALAQMPMTLQHAPSGSLPPSDAGYRDAMERMHRDMAIKLTGNADRDFASGMVPHHQGAIDMARVELAHGTDPELRRLAEDIIAAQEKEIAFMRQWLSRHR